MRPSRAEMAQMKAAAEAYQRRTAPPTPAQKAEPIYEIPEEIRRTSWKGICKECLKTLRKPKKFQVMHPECAASRRLRLRHEHYLANAERYQKRQNELRAARRNKTEEPK